MKRKNHKRRHPRFRRRTKPGEAPGVVKADPDAPPSIIRVMAYSAREIVEEQIRQVDQLGGFLQRWPVVWINVDGLGDAATIKRIGGLFDLHPLALEDVVHVHQRAKVEGYEKHLFIVARMARMSEHLESEQISLFLGKNFVLTFQERPGDCFEPVRQRLRKGRGRIREAGADHLAYALLDAVIDSYFPVVDFFGDRLEQLDEEIVVRPSPRGMAKIHESLGDLLLLRRAIRPHREAVADLIRDAHPLISQETQIYLRDCYDHTVQVIDLLDTYREMCGDLRDFYLSLVSNRMNEIMKVLTIIATIFIPLGFIAGLYGMNFDTSSPWNLPELGWRYGYPLVLLAMLAVVGGLVFFFWRKGWLGDAASSGEWNRSANQSSGRLNKN